MQQTKWLPMLALSLSSLFWAGNFIVGRALRDEVDALTLNYWRWLIALLFLLPFSIRLLKTYAATIKQYSLFLLILAITGIAGFHICVYTALQTTTVVNAVLFLSITPLMIIAGSRVAYKEKINFWQTVGIVISLIGVLVLLVHGEYERLRSLSFNAGDLWMLGAVFFWAVYSVLLKHKPESLPQLPLLTLTIIIGVIIMTPFHFAATGLSLGFEPTFVSVSGLMYISVFASIVAYVCWNYGVSMLGPTTAGSFLHLMPLFGAVLSVFFLGEGVQVYHLTGAVFIASGLVLSSRTAR